MIMNILIDKLKTELKLIFKGYYGFKLFIGTAILFSFIVFYGPIFILHGINIVIIKYNYHYWFSSNVRLIGFFIIIITFILIFWLDILQDFYSRKYRRYRKNERDKRIHRITRLISLFSLALVLFTIPFIALYFPEYLAWLLNFIIIIASVLQYAFLFKEPTSRKKISSLSNFEFNNKYFDVASLSYESSSIKQELKYCKDSIKSGPSHVGTHEFIKRGNEKTSWRGVEAFYQNMSQLFNVLPESITLHDRTYDAIEYTFDEIFLNIHPSKQNPISIVTTDAEYYSIKKELFPNLKNKYDISIHEFAISDLITQNQKPTIVENKLIDYCKEKKPKIIFLSHVFFSSGFELNIKYIANKLLESNPYICIIVDGAQSIGNVNVDSDIFNLVCYYATSAHKWLLAPASLGILFKNINRLKGLNITSIKKPVRPHSYYPIQDENTGVTHSYEPFFGLNAIISKEFLPLTLKIISEHNLNLSRLLHSELLSIDIPYSNICSYSSIVTLHIGSFTKELHRRLGNLGFISSLISIETNGLNEYDNNYIIRFCNHYFHSEDDIYELVEHIENEYGIIKKDTEQNSFNFILQNIKSKLSSRAHGV